MRTVLIGAITAVILTGRVKADPSNLEGGVFIAHYPAAMRFSSDPADPQGSNVTVLVRL